MTKLVAKFMLFASLIAWTILIFMMARADIDYQQNCRGYLKRAADASTIQLAKRELGKALTYAEDNGLTSGSTHSFYPTPATDLEFWYENLKAAHVELETFPEDADALTESNFLMRLRETLVDHDDDGAEVTDPKNISMYPYQRTAALTGVAGLIGIVAGSLMLIPKHQATLCSQKSDAPPNVTTE
ncbi:MAG: hypothetical protein AAFN77_18020 [Planctomycetota bacterium]